MECNDKSKLEDKTRLLERENESLHRKLRKLNKRYSYFQHFHLKFHFFCFILVKKASVCFLKCNRLELGYLEKYVEGIEEESVSI